jgi:hypothetical protein
VKRGFIAAYPSDRSVLQTVRHGDDLILIRDRASRQIPASPLALARNQGAEGSAFFRDNTPVVRNDPGATDTQREEEEFPQLGA